MSKTRALVEFIRQSGKIFDEDLIIFLYADLDMERDEIYILFDDNVDFVDETIDKFIDEMENL